MRWLVEAKNNVGDGWVIDLWLLIKKKCVLELGIKSCILTCENMFLILHLPMNL